VFKEIISDKYINGRCVSTGHLLLRIFILEVGIRRHESHRHWVNLNDERLTVGTESYIDVAAHEIGVHLIGPVGVNSYLLQMAKKSRVIMSVDEFVVCSRIEFGFEGHVLLLARNWSVHDASRNKGDGSAAK
jgi:hypothetical protein